MATPKILTLEKAQIIFGFFLAKSYLCTEIIPHIFFASKLLPMAENIKELNKEVEKLKAQNADLAQQVAELKDQLIRLMSHNLDLYEQLEGDLELRRRMEVAMEIMKGNVERQRNADLKDDGQLLAIIELKVEGEKLHQDPDFDAAALARLVGVSQERLNKLFHHQGIHRTPELYIDNLRLLTAMRMLREKPNYNIASIAEDAGFSHVRTMQRRMQDVIGMTPAEYRAMFTRDV